jgi:RNA polymerase primary sigma factor
MYCSNAMHVITGLALSQSTPQARRQEAWASLAKRRRKAVRLVEELGLRTQRLEPRIIDLMKFSRRVDELRREIDRLEGDRASRLSAPSCCESTAKF